MARNRMKRRYAAMAAASALCGTVLATSCHVQWKQAFVSSLTDLTLSLLDPGNAIGLVTGDDANGGDGFLFNP